MMNFSQLYPVRISSSYIWVKEMPCVCLLSTTYCSCDSGEWLELLTAFLETTVNYDKVLITGDFNFPDFFWNSTHLPNLSDLSPSTGSTELKELTSDFFLHQVILRPARLNHILDLVLTPASENIINLSCIPPARMGIYTHHHLLFFDLLLHAKSKGYDKRTVFDFKHSNWNALQEAVNHPDLILCDSADIDADSTKWKDLFLRTAVKHIPQKFFKRRNTSPWIDGEFKHLFLVSFSNPSV